MISKEILGVTVYEDGSIIGKRGALLSPCDNGRGYLIVSVYQNGKRITKGVHKLVALAFVENPLGLPEVKHKDGNKRNNHFLNLEWTTRGENIRHAFENNLITASGENNARCKTTLETVSQICGLLEGGLSPAQIRDTGYDYELVRAIKARKNWSHVSKDFSF